MLPKTAADFIKEGKGLGSDKVDIIDSAISFSRAMPDDEFSLWFKPNRDLFVDAVSNGYEVEKEQLYYVKLPEVYILGRQVDGVYVEYSEPYLSKIEAELDKHHYETGQSMSQDAGSWKILKYGRPITLEVQHG
ncbi:DUF1642 domain-containing protein [Enterococcus faecalis]|nr:DUF1642 domain-containing protein [Enterococcus faecalis]